MPLLRSTQFRSRRPSVIECLETRVLLAGTVRVGMAGDNLLVTGDRLDNSIVVSLDASSPEDIVQGADGTRIQFAGSFERRAARKSFEDVRIRMLGGDDTVMVHSDGDKLPGNVRILLGTGNDCVAIIGADASPATIKKRLTVRGQSGDDAVLFDNVSVGKHVRTSGSAGNDTVAANALEVGGRTTIRDSRGDDNVLALDSQLNDLRSSGGAGQDLLGIAATDVAGRLIANGNAGSDAAAADDLPDDSRTNFESFDSDPSESPRVDQAITALRAKLTEATDDLPSDSANRVQDAVTNLELGFGADAVQLELDPITQRVTVSDSTPTASVLWDRAVQQAVVNTSPGPTIASRAYAMMHTAMYDAWSAYDETAVSTQLGDDLQQSNSLNTNANKREAMSYAAYRVLDDLFSTETGVLDEVMDELGFDPTNATTDGDSPAAIGNQMAAALLTFRHSDGSNQLGDDQDGTAGVAYSDTTGYAPANAIGDSNIIDRWTPENVPIDDDNAIRSQEFLTPQWGEVTPFGITSAADLRPVAPEPFLLVDGAVVDRSTQTITLSDGTEQPVTRDLIGTVINPAFIEQAEEVIAFSAGLTDEQKMIAEFWEDGGGTSFPPGTFMTFGQFVSARDNNSLDDDVQLFFAMSNAVFDAGVATWAAKVHYDYVRPVRAIRDLGELGLIGEPDDQGVPMIDAWTPSGETQTIPVSEFLTYQTPGSDPSPPFAEYTSGHSAFSAAGARVLELFTGSDSFDASVTFEAGTSRFEPDQTPTSAVTLAWDTFSDAADEAGLSRLYGGIHFTDGDVHGRTLGTAAGQAAWEMTRFYIEGGQ